MKSIYLFEAESVNKYRENIIKERLVYIKYLMDNTSDKKEVSKLEKIYNCLYNINYDSNGKLRTLNDMFTYINQTMTENKGLIPDLPTNDQIQTIDEKAAAFKKLHEVEFNAYLTRFEKVNIDKADNNQKSDDAKSVLSPENPEDNKKALSKIREISSIFGLTNIIGLEPKRQPSSKDMENQKELKLQQKTGDPGAKPEGNEEETEQINKEKSNTEPEQQPGGEDTTKKPGKKPEDTGDKDDTDDMSNMDDKQKQSIQILQELVDSYLEDTGATEYDEQSIDDWASDADVQADLEADDDQYKDFMDKFKSVVKDTIDDTGDDNADDVDKAEEVFGESLVLYDDMSSAYVFEREASTNKKIRKHVVRSVLKSTKDDMGAGLIASGIMLTTGIAATPAAVIGVAAMGARRIKRERTRNLLAGMRDAIEKESDPDKKKELMDKYKVAMKANMKPNGKISTFTQTKNLSPDELNSYNEIKSEAKQYRKAGRKYRFNNPDFETTGLTKDAKKSGVADEIKQAQKNRDSGKKSIMDKPKSKNDEGSEDEEVVKDKDGSEIAVRKKKNGKGSTYIRKKNGKEIGYATKDEYKAAKNSSEKQQKESLSRKSLSDYLLESLQ